MNQWLVLQADGSHLGPVTTELLARGIAAGKVPKDARVGLAGTTDFQAVMGIAEITTALAALDGSVDDDPTGLTRLSDDAPTSPKEVPAPAASEADATEVLRRDGALEAALVEARRSAPPKPPTPPRTSAPPPPVRPSGSMSAPRAPSKPAIPETAALMGPPPPVAAPPPPNTLAMLQPSSPPPVRMDAPVPISPAMGPPPPMGAAPSSFAPPAPAASAAPPPVAAAPAVSEPAKDEPKKPVVDPKLALVLPLGIFGAFVVLALLLVVVALVIKPKAKSAESSDPDTTSAPPR